MRVRLKTDDTEFVQQISAVRAFVGGIHARGGREGVAVRMMAAVYVPYLTTTWCRIWSRPAAGADNRAVETGLAVAGQGPAT